MGKAELRGLPVNPDEWDVLREGRLSIFRRWWQDYRQIYVRFIATPEAARCSTTTLSRRKWQSAVYPRNGPARSSVSAEHLPRGTEADAEPDT